MRALCVVNMDITQALKAFKDEIQKRGHPAEIIWLDTFQMHPTKDKLYIYVSTGFPYERHIVRAYNKLSKNLECGAAIMLVSVDENTSYCTFLVDSFGSDADIEIEEGFYLWCDPYYSSIEFVSSKLKWLCITKFFKSRKLSSLDYAFSIKQSYT